MDHYSILDQGSSKPVPEIVPPTRSPAESRANLPLAAASSLRFPGEDGGKSLAEMAQRDLTVALQLLAERAQYITGASGAAIALREGEELICRARAGPSAPEVGTQLQVSSGLTGESVRSREILRCNDAERDSRVNREICRSLGIASVMVMPLLREQEVIGVFELLSDRTHAFEERDIVALQRLGEMIATAIDHAEAVKHGIQGISTPSPEPHEIPGTGATSSSQVKPIPDDELADIRDSAPISAESRLANIRMCQTCGFPVSGSRTLCLDCEAAQNSQAPASEPGAAPAFLAEIENARQRSWLREHMYTIGIVLMAVLTGLLLLWLHPS
jgi:putative methionine-R-sulfoxide reductase with GAF domain